MPRQARIDAPGLLHHIIARGIERRSIFHDKIDYEDFLSRIDASLAKSPNQILAWALMPNHFHLLVRSGSGGLSRFMRRLMSGYAVAFNARHKRSGYLFQNRFKSFVCDEDSYLLELVRYIHLNPLRAGVVKSIEALGQYPYSGHSAMMGTVKRPWQETSEIMERFGSKKRYEAFLMEGKDQGRRNELVGGGLARSLGGIASALQNRREKDRQAYDSRVLGNGAFVENVLRATENLEKERVALRSKGIHLRDIADKVAEEAGVSAGKIFSRGRTANVSRAKSLLIHIGVEYFGKTTKEMAALTKMTLAAASKSRERGAGFIGDSKLRRLIVS